MTQLPIVTQADRQAMESILWVSTIIDDQEAITQAFAAHRIASNTEAATLIEEMAGEGSFLLARIDELDWSMEPEEFARQWHGHVEPPLARFRAALAKVASHG